MTQTFTLGQAQSALVFVKPILEDIKNRLEEIENIQRVDTNNEEAIKKQLEKIQHFIEELEQVGCVCKNLERGIVDFPTFYKNRAVFLCWHRGEDEIKYWHTKNEGYNDRRLIDEEFIDLHSAQTDLSTIPRQN